MLGKASGKPRILSPEEERIVADVIRRQDRGNDPMSMQDIGSTIQTIKNGSINKQSALDAFRRNVRRHHADKVTGVVRAQPTTTKRSAITEHQQWRWHQLLDDMFDSLIQRNTADAVGELGHCERNTFHSLMPHFILNGDEEVKHCIPCSAFVLH